MNEQKFFVSNYRNRVDLAANEYYGDCQFRGVPFIHVCKRGKRTSILYDYKTLPDDVVELLKANSAEVTSQICAATGRRRAPDAPPVLADLVQDLDVETAEVIAGKIFDILMQYSTVDA